MENTSIAIAFKSMFLFFGLRLLFYLIHPKEIPDINDIKEVPTYANDISDICTYYIYLLWNGRCVIMVDLKVLMAY